MGKVFTKEHMIKRYKEALKILINEEEIYMTILMRDEWVEIDTKNKSEYILKIKELINELEEEILLF